MSIEPYNEFMEQLTSHDIRKKIKKTLYNDQKELYVKDKINILEYNPGLYWCSLSEENKEKLLNLMELDYICVHSIDNFIKFSYNTPAEEIIEKLYGKKFDDDCEENLTKIFSLIEDFPFFWNNLEKAEKEKYIEMVYNKHNYYYY